MSWRQVYREKPYFHTYISYIYVKSLDRIWICQFIILITWIHNKYVCLLHCYRILNSQLLWFYSFLAHLSTYCIDFEKNRIVPPVILYLNCLNGSAPLHKMAASAEKWKLLNNFFLWTNAWILKKFYRKFFYGTLYKNSSNSIVLHSIIWLPVLNIYIYKKQLYITFLTNEMFFIWHYIKIIQTVFFCSKNGHQSWKKPKLLITSSNE